MPVIERVAYDAIAPLVGRDQRVDDPRAVVARAVGLGAREVVSVDERHG
jgi:hypothetical protein